MGATQNSSLHTMQMVLVQKANLWICFEDSASSELLTICFIPFLFPTVYGFLPAFVSGILPTLAYVASKQSQRRKKLVYQVRC